MYRRNRCLLTVDICAHVMAAAVVASDKQQVFLAETIFFAIARATRVKSEWTSLLFSPWEKFFHLLLSPRDHFLSLLGAAPKWAPSFFGLFSLIFIILIYLLLCLLRLEDRWPYLTICPSFQNFKGWWVMMGRSLQHEGSFLFFSL